MRSFNWQRLFDQLKAYWNAHNKIIVLFVAFVVTIGFIIQLTSGRLFMARGGGDPIAFDTIEHSLHRRALHLPVKDLLTRKLVEKKVRLFYEANAWQTKWLGEKGPNNLFQEFLKTVNESYQLGLQPDHYNMASLEAKVKEVFRSRQVSEDDIIETDFRISEMYFLFTTHLLEGRIRKPAAPGKIWKRIPKGESLADVNALIAVNSASEFDREMNKLEPQSPGYEQLKRSLGYYYLTAQNQTQNNLFREDIRIRPGERSDLVPAIRAKLSSLFNKQYEIATDSVSGKPDSLLYKHDLVDAVKTFQRTRGLNDTGIVEGATVRWLNQSFEEISNTISLNMERLRWKPVFSKDQYAIVNIPEYVLRVFENGNEKLKTNVIVGEIEKATPVFTSQITHVIFSPTWTIPTSIIREEIIPKLQDNPEYFSNSDFLFYKDSEVIDPEDEEWTDESINPNEYTIVQQPGDDNSLGKVKFLLQNRMNIYLHDTPNRKLFSQAYRALSHGCVRVQNPDVFAKYLLDEKKYWTGEKISEAMDGEQPKTVKIPKPFPVMIEYNTAWVDEQGFLNLRDDVYGHDAYQLQKLEEISVSPYAAMEQQQSMPDPN